MAKENFLAPGPKQSDFDTLSSTVSTLNSNIASIGTITSSIVTDDEKSVANNGYFVNLDVPAGKYIVMYELIGEANIKGWINAIYSTQPTSLEYCMLKIVEANDVATVTMPITTATTKTLAIHNFNGATKKCYKGTKIIAMKVG